MSLAPPDFGPKYSCGSQARLEESKYTRSSGPGSYTIKDNEKGKSVTLQERWKSTGNLRDGLTPGPGTYVPSVASGVVFERGPKFSFGTGARPRDHSLSCPGPGQYLQEFLIGIQFRDSRIWIGIQFYDTRY